jgi:hypothetical protein
LSTPSKHYGIEVFPYQYHGEEVEEKTRSCRQSKKLKRRQEMKERRSREERPSQEDERVRLQDLEFIHPTSQPKPKNLLKLFLLSVLHLLTI